MADITLTVDVSSLTQASQKLNAFGKEVNKFSVIGLSRGINTLQSNIRELVSAQRQGTIGSSAYQLGLLQIKRAYEQMGYSSQAATAAVRRYAAELQRQEAVRAAEQAARELARAQQEAAAAAQKLADRQEDLRRRFQEGYALFDRQRKAMRDLREAYRANIITMQQYQNQLARIRAGDFSEHMNQQSDGMNKFGVAAQQTGYQVSDFIVQVQGGTNPLVAFSQQATQLAGLLYLLPPALLASQISLGFFSVSLATASAGLTILIPLLAMLAQSFFSSGGESLTLSEGLEKVKSSTDAVNRSFDILQRKDLALEFGSMTETVTGLSAAMLELDKSAQLKNLIASLETLEDKGRANLGRHFLEGFYNIGRFVDPFSEMKGTSQVDEEAYQKLGLSMARAQFFSYQEELLTLAKTGDREGVAKLIETMVQDATDFGATADKVSLDGYSLLSNLSSVAVTIAETAALLNGSAKDSERLVEAEKIKTQHAERYYQIQLEQGALNKELEADVQNLLNLRDDEYRKLVQEKDLLQAIYAFGKDSIEVKEKEAQFAREAYEAELENKGLKGNFLNLLMEEYDLVAAVKKEMGEISPLQQEINEYAQQFSQIDLASGVEIAASAALALAKNLGISLETAQGMMALGYGAPVVYDPRDPNFDPEKAAAGRSEQLRKDRFGFNYSTTVTGAKLKDPTKGGAGGGSETESALEKLQEQLALEKELLGTTESYQKVRSALGEDFVNTSPKIIEGLIQQADEIKNLTRLEEERQSLMDSINDSLETGFMAMVKGTQTVGEAFRTMAAAIIEELFRVLVVKKLVEGVTNVFGGGTFTNVAGLTGGGRASGGSMMAGGSYLVGENGPEIVVPRHSGTVVNANQTSGAMAGSGGFTQNLSINVTGSDAAMVRQEVAKMIPQITNATKAAVIDAKQRGGQMAQAFR
jgi:hypothetical protein